MHLKGPLGNIESDRLHGCLRRNGKFPLFSRGCEMSGVHTIVVVGKARFLRDMLPPLRGVHADYSSLKWDDLQGGDHAYRIWT